MFVHFPSLLFISALVAMYSIVLHITSNSPGPLESCDVSPENEILTMEWNPYAFEQAAATGLPVIFAMFL